MEEKSSDTNNNEAFWLQDSLNTGSLGQTLICFRALEQAVFLNFVVMLAEDAVSLSRCNENLNDLNRQTYGRPTNRSPKCRGEACAYSSQIQRKLEVEHHDNEYERPKYSKQDPIRLLSRR